jgi:4-amino-4-deoxy-L-arabinose transferase-like glycosyltransferase
MAAWIDRLRRVEAWVASRVIGPIDSGRRVLPCIALFVVIGWLVLFGFKFTQDIFKDSAEAYAWGRHLLGGYGRHPPLRGWIAGLWYAVFPAQDWAAHLLARVMAGACLGTIYVLARQLLGSRRALLLLFAMMLYPVLLGAKSDRFTNYLILLALLPATISAFLFAIERRTALAGALLGAVAGAAMLTIYSAALGLAGIALAAMLHPDRDRFLASPAPYVAGATFLVVVLPHIVWLVAADFAPLRWAGSQAGSALPVRATLAYLGHQFGLIAIPTVTMAAVLLPWRWARRGPVVADARIAAFVVCAAVLILVPPLIALPLRVILKLDWGESLFFVVPIVLLVIMRRVRVTRRAVVRMAMVAAVVALAQAIAAPFYALLAFKARPAYDAYTPTSELAAEVTRLWRARFASPLPIIAATFDLAAPIAFYSPDHPRMFADSPDEPRVFAADQPAFSPWIDYPGDLRTNGFVGICVETDVACLRYLARLAPGAEIVPIEVRRAVAGFRGPPFRVRVAIAGPEKHGGRGGAP